MGEAWGGGAVVVTIGCGKNWAKWPIGSVMGATGIGCGAYGKGWEQRWSAGETPMGRAKKKTKTQKSIAGEPIKFGNTGI